MSVGSAILHRAASVSAIFTSRSRWWRGESALQVVHPLLRLTGGPVGRLELPPRRLDAAARVVLGLVSGLQTGT